MTDGGSSALFVGDLSDPWVVDLASALPAETKRLHCPEFLPETWPRDAERAPVVVLHRAFLSDTDADRLLTLRGRSTGPPRVVLCVGPQVRAFQVERWRPLVDVVLPEATASEIVARYAEPPDTFSPESLSRNGVCWEGEAPAKPVLAGTAARREPRPPTSGTDSERKPPRSRPRILVVSSDFELRLTLADACQRAGYPAQPVTSWADAPPEWPAVWDVPVLEPDWPLMLKQEADTRPVLALMGFADRELVSLARSLGASACLDLPVDPADLAFVLDRMTARERRSGAGLDPAHPVPPAPAGLRRRSSLMVESDCDA